MTGVIDGISEFFEVEGNIEAEVRDGTSDIWCGDMELGAREGISETWMGDKEGVNNDGAIDGIGVDEFNINNEFELCDISEKISRIPIPHTTKILFLG